MTKLLVEDTSLTTVADAIRTKGGTSEGLTFPDGFVSAIEMMSSGSSGEVWEEVDLTNWPTDWEVGDRVKLGIKKNVKATASNWTSAPSISGITLSISCPQIVEFELIKGSTASVGIPFNISRGGAGYISFGVIHVIGGVTRWNTGDNTLFSLDYYVINGSGSKSTSADIYTTNISTYVYKMWRWRSHSGDTGGSGGGAN